jgi:hypothetical protein
VTAAAALTPAPAPAHAAMRRAPTQAGASRGEDPDRWVDRARAAQRTFERRRVRTLSPAPGVGGGRCDETVGRMCVTLQETSDWWPEPDPPELVAAREELLDTLARALAGAPGHEWILGQRVVYLGEAGRWNEALAEAQRCGGGSETWWCRALAGVALHRLGRYPDAEAAFRRALVRMPPEERRRWTRMELLLDGDASGGFDDALARAAGDPAGRAALVERWWRLADPLLLVPGNDRLTEHWTRLTVARTREQAGNPYATSWGRDLEELLVRYGVEAGWSLPRPRPRAVGAGPRGALGQHHPRSRGFLPPAGAWTDPAGTGAEAWNPGSRRTPRTFYAPEYAPVFLPAPVQVAVSRRGERIVVRAGIGLPDDTTWHSGHDHPPLPRPPHLSDARRRRGLFLVPAGAPDAPVDTVRGVAVPDSEGGALSLTAPAGDWVVSVEIWDPVRGLAGRYRAGLRSPAVPADVPTLSGLLLAEARGPVPEAIDPFLAHVAAPPRPRPGATLRVGWEVSGLGWQGAEELDYRLELVQEQGGLVRRVGRWLGLVGEPERVDLAWREVGPADPDVVFRAVDLDLPPGLSEGRYTVHLVLEIPGRQPLRAERAVEVRRGPAGPGGLH